MNEIDKSTGRQGGFPITGGCTDENTGRARFAAALMEVFNFGGGKIIFGYSVREVFEWNSFHFNAHVVWTGAILPCTASLICLVPGDKGDGLYRKRNQNPPSAIDE
ncbi:hypothetical protein CDAR_209661 [Caerostris darwini]|uniref:Uncharacterized protein n=1 Tax=Caerostris darwini TaxID=1538125 RepID=A0AAV4T2Z2_9ARAC|nr:hypothetical protein CDAR_209661 [Caerostris darwini]